MADVIANEAIAKHPVRKKSPRKDGKYIYDIAIIGAGAVGSAIERELSRYDLKVVLMESNSDVGMGTSKTTTAI